MTPTAAQLLRIRKMIDESGTTRFTDAELTSICTDVSNVYFAASEAWAEKAAMMQREMGDIVADGWGEESTRFVSLSARINYAMKMVEYYAVMGQKKIGSMVFGINGPTVIHEGTDAVES